MLSQEQVGGLLRLLPCPVSGLILQSSQPHRESACQAALQASGARVGTRLPRCRFGETATTLTRKPHTGRPGGGAPLKWVGKDQPINRCARLVLALYGLLETGGLTGSVDDF